MFNNNIEKGEITMEVIEEFVNPGNSVLLFKEDDRYGVKDSNVSGTYWFDEERPAKVFYNKIVARREWRI